MLRYDFILKRRLSGLEEKEVYKLSLASTREQYWIILTYRNNLYILLRNFIDSDNI